MSNPGWRFQDTRRMGVDDNAVAIPPERLRIWEAAHADGLITRDTLDYLRAHPPAQKSPSERSEELLEPGKANRTVLVLAGVFAALAAIVGLAWWLL